MGEATDVAARRFDSADSFSGLSEVFGVRGIVRLLAACTPVDFEDPMRGTRGMVEKRLESAPTFVRR